ncbi:MAG: hypothetical protein MGG11_04265 [Trichodesmium sp. MAG_R03]|nr:hypothetical protein [Trichodesmium sp. MAG_R03]
MKDELTQTNVAKILGVSFQRVHTLRIRNRINFCWDVNKQAWLTSQEHLQRYINQRGKRVAASNHK